MSEKVPGAMKFQGVFGGISVGFTGVARGVLAVNLKGSLGLSRVFGDIFRLFRGF